MNEEEMIPDEYDAAEIEKELWPVSAISVDAEDFAIRFSPLLASIEEFTSFSPLANAPLGHHSDHSLLREQIKEFEEELMDLDLRF